MPKKITAGIIGATGYTGLELIRILAAHPRVSLSYLASSTHRDSAISELWPHLKGVCDLKLSTKSPEAIAKASDITFLALPHGETHKLVPRIINLTKIIDLSGDFRLKDIRQYEKYYGRPHEFPKGVKQFTYGIPEFKRTEITCAKHIANPGCFAITAQLALAPLAAHIRHASLLAVTGSSGAGKIPKEETLHPVRNHNMTSYKIGMHQHLPEIMQGLSLRESQLTMIPTSGPFTRGIHLTAFVDLAKPLSAARVQQLYAATYKNAPFVRLKKNVQLAEVVGSNFCDIAIHDVQGKIVVQAVIDNLVKGAAGTAVQNMNLVCGFPETEGLLSLSPLFP